MEPHQHIPGVLSPTLKNTISEQIKTALKEDIGSGDLSTTGAPDTKINAVVISRDAGVLAGVFWFDEVFSQIDTSISVHWNLRDGDLIRAQQKLCCVRGNGRKILSGERSALNFLQTLSATATVAHHFVSQSGGKVKIMDTRKTIPGLRVAQKYAAACGGAVNHRQGLFDGILIKENHIALYGSIEAAVTYAHKNHPEVPVEVEVENLQQVSEALATNADIILLDNFSISNIKKAVQIIGTDAEIEVSGNVILDNFRSIVATGVDRISIGAMTKNIQALDMSMRYTR